jgi:signal transduction histidine kinase
MGYRLRMTLAFGLLALLSVVLLTLLLLTTSYREFKADRMMSVERMTSCFAGNIFWDMQAGGDPRRLAESVNRFASGIPAPTPPEVRVLDGLRHSQIGNRGILGPNAQTASELELLLARLDAGGANVATAETASGFVSAARVERDGLRLGSVWVDYPLVSLQGHFFSLFEAALGYGVSLLLVLLFLGWLLGRRLMQPIANLRQCMQRVGQGNLDVQCDLARNAVRSQDEIGDLARGFEEMLASLRDKQRMEQEMMRSERLAAIGQVAAGVAHEINNPLGGMLNAINTFKRHGDDPAVAESTLNLLERGLRQIQNTVQALLVQARVEAYPLGVADLDDLRTLVQAEVRKKGLTLEWQCLLTDRVALPSTAVRQILINLLLNAIEAAPQGGKVTMRCVPQDGQLQLRVEDNGPGIEPAQRSALFAPFFSGAGGHGLGLWVTNQTVQQLGGHIEIIDLPQGTAVSVCLPLGGEESGAAVSANAA